MSRTSPILTSGPSPTFRTFAPPHDREAICTLSTRGVSDDPQFQERRLVRKMGRTLTAAMISAFACELAMKAIALTAKDEAAKSHDLDALYAELPRTKPFAHRG